MGPLPSSPYLGSEHVRQAVGGSMEREAPDQVDDEHTVRQQRCEVYHLWAPEHTVSSLQEQALQGPQAQAGRPAIPTERHGTISAVWATGSWEGIVVLGQTWVLSLGNWVVDMDAHACGPQEISCSGEKREQVLESSVLQPPFNSTLFQKGLEAAHRNTS